MIPYIGANGNWWLGDTDTGVQASVQGEKGDTGAAGKDGAKGTDGKNGTDGRDGVNGKDGINGKDGKDGQTPYIGENGNWWIGATDTGVKAKADDVVLAVSDAVAEPGSDNTVAVIAVTVAGVSLLSNLALILYMVLKKKNRVI